MARGRRVTGVVLWSIAGVLSAVAILAFVASATLLAIAATVKLPDLNTAATALAVPRTSIVYAADGSVIAEWHGGQDRKVVPLASVPKAMRDAAIAAEDPAFYTHDGVRSAPSSRAWVSGATRPVGTRR
jgi:membrane carboxypeptidase/penicillin-binding protein